MRDPRVSNQIAPESRATAVVHRYCREVTSTALPADKQQHRRSPIRREGSSRSTDIPAIPRRRAGTSAWEVETVRAFVERLRGRLERTNRMAARPHKAPFADAAHR